MLLSHLGDSAHLPSPLAIYEGDRTLHYCLQRGDRAVAERLSVVLKSDSVYNKVNMLFLE